MEFTSAAFWAALGSIIWVNIILSGDNAVVIALAARSLPSHQQKQAIFWGSAAAVLLRVVLTVFAVKLLELPWLKVAGGALRNEPRHHVGRGSRRKRHDKPHRSRRKIGLGGVRRRARPARKAENAETPEDAEKPGKV